MITIRRSLPTVTGRVSGRITGRVTSHISANYMIARTFCDIDLHSVVIPVVHYVQVSSVAGATVGTVLGFKCGLAKNTQCRTTRCVDATLGAAAGAIIGGIVTPCILPTIVVLSPWMKCTVGEDGIHIFD